MTMLTPYTSYVFAFVSVWKENLAIGMQVSTLSEDLSMPGLERNSDF